MREHEGKAVQFLPENAQCRPPATSPKLLSWALALVILATGALVTPQAGSTELRVPIGAGEFYPENGASLLTTVRKYFAEADTPEITERVAAVVTPHAAYGFSGDVAAHAFKHIQPGQYDRVVILAPSHFAPVEGCSIPLTQAFVTPLGPVALDQEAIQRLANSSLIDTRSLHYDPRSERRPTHEREFAIEVVLPFLQERIGQFLLVPILVGNLVDLDADFREDRLAVVAESLGKILNDRTLLVVSTDFTHYGARYDYTPFDEAVDLPTAIRGLDRKAFELLLRKDGLEFQRFLRNTRVPICGHDALLLMLKLLPRNAKGEVLAYLSSGERLGQPEPSVSYGAMVFYEPGTAAPSPRPLRQLLPSQEVLEERLRQVRETREEQELLAPAEKPEGE